MTQPPAIACPLIAATTGLGNVKSVRTRAGQQRQEAPYVVRAFLSEPKQVHPRGEDRSRSRQDECTDIVGNSVEFAEEGVEQFDIDRAHLPVRQAEGENAFVLRTFDPAT